MKFDLLRLLGPATQLMFLIVIILVCFLFMQFTAFLVIRPIWQVNIFEDVDYLMKLKDETSIQITKVLQVFYHCGMFLLPALLFRKIFSAPEKPFFTLERNHSVFIWISAALFFFMALPFVNFLHAVNLQIPISENMVQDNTESTELLGKLLGGNGTFPLLINIFIYALLPALGEEFLFRGVIMRQIALSTKKVHLAIWVSAVFFSFIHMESTAFIPRFLMGVALGYLFFWSGSIWIGVLAHFINNVVGIIMVNSILNDRLDPYYFTMGMNASDGILVASSIICTGLLLFYFYQKRNNSYVQFMTDYEEEERKKFQGDDDILE